MSIFWLAVSVFIWGIVHSYLATIEVKDWVQTTFGDAAIRFYRLAYNIFSVISFVPILWLMVVLPDRVLYRIPAPWLYLTLTVQGAAVIFLILGVLQTGPMSFIGLRQLIEGEKRSSELVTIGLYRWVRHPLYSAGLLFIWLTPVMTRNTLLVIISATIYIILGAFFEERKLEREFGQAYKEYKAETPMFIPGLKFKRNK